MLLDDLNRDYPSDWSLRSSLKRRRQLDLVLESKAPQHGIYRWRPSLSSWILECFFVDEFGSVNHYEVWRKWAGTMLGVDAVVPHTVLDAYCGLPRGRITKQPTRWVIRHGDDLHSLDHLNQIISDFNLPADKCDITHDKHEDLVPKHVAIVEEFLGRTLPKFS